MHYQHGCNRSGMSFNARRRKFLRMFLRGAGATMFAGLAQGQSALGKPPVKRPRKTSPEPAVAVGKLVRSNQQWRRLLTSAQYKILREAGTEPAYSNRYHDYKIDGTYACVGCGNRLFSSTAKFDSGTGWPSFFQPIDSGVVVEQPDNTLFTRRTEVVCSRCDGHLGHVFDDGPRPTGLRYCLNSTALTFFRRVAVADQKN